MNREEIFIGLVFTIGAIPILMLGDIIWWKSLLIALSAWVIMSILFWLVGIISMITLYLRALDNNDTRRKNKKEKGNK